MAGNEIMTLGNYLLVERLHLGEKGETFVARQGGGDKQIVAVKRLLAQAAEDKEHVANFLLTAHLAAPIEHEAICAFKDFGSIDGVHYAVREYVGGKDLRDLQRRHVLQRRLIPDGVVLHIARQLCNALVEVHEAADKGDVSQPRLYGDVDPRNVLVGFNGEVKLIGFGLQSRAESDRVSPDVRQFGAMLYALTTGKPATPDGNAKGAAPPPPCEIRASVSKDLSKIVMQALGAGGSFASIRELKQALDRYCDSVSTVGSASDLSALMKRLFAGALRIEKERTRRVTTAALPKAAQASGPPKPVEAKSAAVASAPTEPAARPDGRSSKAEQRAARMGSSIESVAPVAAASERKSLIGYAALAVGATMLLLGGGFFATAGSSDVPAEAVAPDTPGQLQVVSQVPVDVFLDDSKAKLSTPVDRTVRPGQHGLTIVIRATQRRLERQIEVKPGQTVRVKLNNGPTGARDS